jgi:hypothetical protein
VQLSVDGLDSSLELVDVDCIVGRNDGGNWSVRKLVCHVDKFTIFVAKVFVGNLAALDRTFTIII